MAKAKAAKAPAKTTRKKWDAELEIEWGGLSIGDSTARLGLKIERNRINLDEADELFCGTRCAVQIENVLPDPKQAQLPGMEGHQIVLVEALVDIKSFNVTPKLLSTGLTFNLETVHPELLAKFPKRRGRLFIKHQADLADEAGDEDDE